MSKGSSSPPPYVPPTPAAPDPYATANAQQHYNVNSAVAQTQLNNANQITPYGTINWKQTGGSWVGAQPEDPGTPSTGGYWDGHQWVPTGGTKGHPATQGDWVPTWQATTTLTPQLQHLVDTGIMNAQTASDLQGQMMHNVSQQATHPIDLSWGNKQAHIWGLERQSMDPMWSQESQNLDQRLANQGLTPGSQGWQYAKTQFGTNKSNAYTNAMLQAQGQASQDIQTEYNSPLNWLNALRSGSQIQQYGVGQTPAAAQGNVPASNYAGIAQGNYATSAGIYNNAVNAQQQYNQAQQQQQNQLMGGLFGLGGSLLQGLGGIL